ncbi:MAG TPA: alpha/beta hydrolase [Dehalococcoidia bacterium]|nr:alpha/beta hydrolase [Dehalococcoidia bacterium]
MPLVRRPDAEIHYEVFDFGPPWRRRTPVLLHHGLALSTRFWYSWLPTLLADHPVIALDLRGHGRSSVPDPGWRWTFETLAEDALAVLDAAGYDRCHFVGESVGGTLGLFCAARHPDRLVSLTAVSTAYRGDYVRNLDDWEDLLARGGSAGWSRAMMDRRFDPATIDPDLAAWYEVEQAKLAPDTVLAIVRLLQGADLTDDLPRIAAPTLLLSPERSPFVEADLMAQAHALIPRSELLYFRGARHGLINSHPDACARAVVEFIRRRVTPTS